jgi:hypothetical protein
LIKQIRKYSVDSNEVTTIIGSGATGPVTSFGLNVAAFSPHGIAVDTLGYLYVTDSGTANNNKILKQDQSTMLMSTISVPLTGGPVYSFIDVWVDSVGYIYALGNLHNFSM